uniref:Uncharacterized protein isoform X1 n=1 Tax=Nicotiana tabacum TaxID=4097 RepID=A0A1S4BFQ2_TOBAC|nr:PREDICTED: uncharacterized protein LOC107807800 isoform X1 [Nicotiana tabacum]
MMLCSKCGENNGSFIYFLCLCTYSMNQFLNGDCMFLFLAETTNSVSMTGYRVGVGIIPTEPCRTFGLRVLRVLRVATAGFFLSSVPHCESATAAFFLSFTVTPSSSDVTILLLMLKKIWSFLSKLNLIWQQTEEKLALLKEILALLMHSLNKWFNYAS